MAKEKTIEVRIDAIQRVTLSRTVQMKQSDYDKYLRICENLGKESLHTLDKQAEAIAFRYGWGGGKDQIDWDDPEDLEFWPTPLTEDSEVE